MRQEWDGERNGKGCTKRMEVEGTSGRGYDEARRKGKEYWAGKGWNDRNGTGNETARNLVKEWKGKGQARDDITKLYRRNCNRQEMEYKSGNGLERNGSGLDGTQHDWKERDGKG